MKKFCLAIVCLVALNLVISVPIYANDQEEKGKSEKIFDMNTFNETVEKAEKKSIVADKTEQNGTGLKITSKTRLSVYPTRKGVILVTKDKYKGLIPTGHAAIIYSKGTVIESLSKGVIKGKNDWKKSKGTCYGVTVKSTNQKQDESSANGCKGKIGKPYNYNFLNVNTRKKFYCSQLVWAAYKDKYNINLNTSDFGKAVHPMELVATSKTYKIYEK